MIKTYVEMVVMAFGLNQEEKDQSLYYNAKFKHPERRGRCASGIIDMLLSSRISLARKSCFSASAYTKRFTVVARSFFGGLTPQFHTVEQKRKQLVLVTKVAMSDVSETGLLPGAGAVLSQFPYQSQDCHTKHPVACISEPLPPENTVERPLLLIVHSSLFSFNRLCRPLFILQRPRHPRHPPGPGPERGFRAQED